MVEGLNFIVAVIMNEHDEILLLRRSEKALRDPGRWGLCGGRLEPGEDPIEGMSREIREELGTELQLRLEARLGPLPAIGRKGGTVHLYHYSLTSGSLQLNHEHTEFRWLDKAAYSLAAAATNSDSALDLMPGVDEDLTFFGIWPDRTS